MLYYALYNAFELPGKVQVGRDSRPSGNPLILRRRLDGFVGKFNRLVCRIHMPTSLLGEFQNFRQAVEEQECGHIIER